VELRDDSPVDIRPLDKMSLIKDVVNKMTVTELNDPRNVIRLFNLFVFDDIITKYKDQFAATDLQNARANWAQASRLDRIDKALNTKSVIGPTPVEFRPKGIDPGYVNGKAFSKQIYALEQNGALADLTPEHIQSLKDLGTLLEKSGNVHKFGQLAKLTELGGTGLTGVLHPTAAIAGAKAALPGYLMYRALGRVMTDPEAASTVVNLLKASEPVAPVVSAQSIEQSTAQ
jgi:hypothetical protein